MTHKVGLHCGLSLGLLCAWSTAGLAQTPGPGGRTIYELAWFQSFAPSTALQVVERVPGFTIESIDPSVRGFGQTAGNVVINGQRPSSKSDTLQTILSRIPATRVARVEVGPGELFGSEFAGKPQVVNLILTAGGGLAGTVQAGVRRDFTGRLTPEGSVSALVRRGPSTFNVSAGVTNNTTSEEGYDTVRSAPERRLTEYRDKLNVIEDPNYFGSASWEYDGGAHRSAHLNGKISWDRLSLTQTNYVFPEFGPDRNDRLTQRFHSRDFEIGGDVTRPLWGGGLKLIGLATRRHRINREVSLERIDSALLEGSTQRLEDQRDESLFRLVWNRELASGWAIETGGEGVLNRLKSDTDLFDIDADGGQTPVELPLAHAVVRETRGEIFVNAARALSPSLRMDLNLTYEASRLTVSGDAESERVLRFLKPKASFDWRPNRQWHLQVSLARTVAQLQFEDFVSSAELASDQVNGGNADLQPQRAWEFLVTAEHPLLGDGLIKLEAGYTAVQMVQDRVPTPEGLDAPGNLGSGTEYIARATLDIPLERLGIKGGRFTTYHSVVLTSVEDPYTHRHRPFSGSSAYLFNANFRQDLGKFAWGFGLSGNTPGTFYRRDELDKSFGTIPYVTAFVEYRPNAKTTFSLGVDNLTDVPVFRDRTFFSPDRRTADPDEYEHRHRNQHIIPYLTLKHSFG